MEKNRYKGIVKKHTPKEDTLTNCLVAFIGKHLGSKY